MTKYYKVTAPIGTVVVPNERMTEEELRKFVSQLIQDADQAKTWIEKAKADPISNLLEWLERAEFKVETTTE